MIRENQKYLNRLQVFLDLFFVVLSFGLAYYTRFYFLSNGTQSLSTHELVLPLVAILPVYTILYHLFDLYSAKRTKPTHVELSAIFKTNVLTTFLLMVILYILKLQNFSRVMIIFFALYNLILTIGSRIGIRFALRKYRRLGYNLKHCLIIGTTASSGEFIKKVHKNKHWGYHILGIVHLKSPINKKSMAETNLSTNKEINIDTNFFIDKSTNTSTLSSAIHKATKNLHTEQHVQTPETFMNYPVLGNLRALETILMNKQPDMIIIGAAGDDVDELGQALALCEKAGIKTQIIPYYYKYIPAKPYMDDLDGLPVIDIRHVPLDNVFKAFSKRLFDIVFSSVVILAISPLLLFTAIMTKLTSPGPILFKQERVGLNRQPFYMYKFRSMRVQTEADEKSEWTTKHDPRKTWWGSFMRRTSIDEFPQFFNVLMGDMSVVGPRPERPFFVDKFKEDIPRYMIKHQVRPGITGWAQVNGFRGDTSIEGRIEHDLHYIENWTFALDLRIIFQTVLKGFINKNAY